MKRNGLVFVPPETSKRVILYANQDSTNQQIQVQYLNGQQIRSKTAIVTNQTNESNGSTSNNSRSLRQQSHSSQPNGSVKQSEKSSNVYL